MKSTKVCLKTALQAHFNLTAEDEALDSVPTKYQKHDDCVIFNEKDYSHGFWKQNQTELWLFVASFFNVAKLGMKSAIADDNFRSPNCVLVFGEDPWVTHKDNGIVYFFNITKSMFCFGNITEKLRISKFDCDQETVVDMFAGIGYFTLPYLVRANAKKVYACEWNPHSCEALKRGLVANKVESKCEILQGDNRDMCPVGVADRVNLGLIPDCSDFYETACKALVDKGGLLHIHRNVTTGGNNEELASVDLADLLSDPILSTQCNTESMTHSQMVCQKVGLSICANISRIMKNINEGKAHKIHLLKVNKVKNYAPHIKHFVFDIRVENT